MHMIKCWLVQYISKILIQLSLFLQQQKANRTMQASDFHRQLNPVVSKIIKYLQDLDDVDDKNLEIEFKYAFCKGPNSPQGLENRQTAEQRSKSEIIVLNIDENFRKLKINAGCNLLQMQNATANLKTISKSIGCKVEERYFLYINWLQEKYLYDCTLGRWVKVQKSKFFNQCNVLSNKKYYRVNFCTRNQVHEVQKFIKQIKVYLWRISKGFLRFKRSLIFHIDSQYFIECNTIYETKQQSQYAIVEQVIQQSAALEKIIKQTLEQRIKEEKVKTEIELKMTPKGINNFRNQRYAKKKALVSRAFDQFRNITISFDEPDLEMMIGNMSLQTKSNSRYIKIIEKNLTERPQKQQLYQDFPKPKRQSRRRND